MMIMGKYDILRDDGIRYANQLLDNQILCELILAPRVGNGFCTVLEKLIQWVHERVSMSLRRELGMI